MSLKFGNHKLFFLALHGANLYKSEPIKQSFSIIPINPMGHYVIEVIGSYEPIVVQISFGKHFVKLLVSHVFSQILCYSLKLHYRYFSLFMDIKR